MGRSTRFTDPTRDEAKQDEDAPDSKTTGCGSTSVTRAMPVQCEKPWTGSTMSSTRRACRQSPVVRVLPLQAVATNVNGSDNVIRAAHDCGVKSVVPKHRQGRISGQRDGFEQGDDGARGGGVRS